MTRPHVVIVGGGIAGLSAAWTLSQDVNSPRITVLESTSRLGGKIQTSLFAGLPVDNAADAFLTTVPAARNLCEQLGLTSSLVAPASSQAWIWSRGKLKPFPLGTVLGVPSNIFSLARVISIAGMARSLLDLVLPARVGRTGNDPSIGNFIRKRLGNEVADRLIDPLIGGINAGSIDDLSMRSAAPQVQALADSHRSVFIAARRKVPKNEKNAPKKGVFLAPEGGMQQLVDTLVQRLRHNGVEFRTAQEVTTLTRPASDWTVVANNESVHADAVILATPASHTSALVRDLDSRAATILASLRYSSVAMVRMAYRKNDVGRPLDGSGFVVPAKDRTLVTACSWSSSKWARLEKPNEVILRVSAGRLNDTRAAAMDDSALVDALHRELQSALELQGSPVTSDVTRWPNAFPQYEPGHADRISLVRSFLSTFGPLELAGAAYDGVGIPACIESGNQAAMRVRELLAK
jgi:oxygen-dependent protoporphyrinogen oxidase